MTFSELGLHENILKALIDSGYTSPTPVQAQAIPAALEGHDLMVCSQTGSGKTAAFMLPCLHRLALQPWAERAAVAPAPAASKGRKRFSQRPVRLTQPAQPRMLVLAPTRELAQQVTTATEKYGRYFKQIKAAAILGGIPYPKQIAMLAQNPDILVATPGRLIDHLESGKIDCSQVQILVLDEADRMLDMGFIEDIEKIIATTPETRQTWLFSATLDGEIGKIARNFTRNAKTIQVDSPRGIQQKIAQRLHFVDDIAHKNRLLEHLLSDTEIDQAIIFTATKINADNISDRLHLSGFNSAALHGDMPQGARNRTLNALRRKQVRFLVATDVAARGIDVPSITHVFNFDLPKFAEDYVHRIGRTGRAGRSGQAISLVNHAEQFQVRKIERFTGQDIPVETVEGFEPTRQPAAKRNGPDRTNRQKKKPHWAAASTSNRSGNNTGRPSQSQPKRKQPTRGTTHQARQPSR